jgi:hypothetical protein
MVLRLLYYHAKMVRQAYPVSSLLCCLDSHLSFLPAAKLLYNTFKLFFCKFIQMLGCVAVELPYCQSTMLLWYHDAKLIGYKAVKLQCRQRIMLTSYQAPKPWSCQAISLSYDPAYSTYVRTEGADLQTVLDSINGLGRRPPSFQIYVRFLQI